MNEDFWTMFPKEVEELDDSGEIRALIVSSTGPHFSAGIDLSMFKDDIVENETFHEKIKEMEKEIVNLKMENSAQQK